MKEEGGFFSPSVRLFPFEICRRDRPIVGRIFVSFHNESLRVSSRRTQNSGPFAFLWLRECDHKNRNPTKETNGSNFFFFLSISFFLSLSLFLCCPPTFFSRIIIRQYSFAPSSSCFYHWEKGKLFRDGKILHFSLVKKPAALNVSILFLSRVTTFHIPFRVNEIKTGRIQRV